MGLDAHVCCNCIKEGLAPPHPFPERLVFDETAEATMKSDGQISLEEWLKHDAWYRTSCAHSGRLIKKRLGNIWFIGHVREFLEAGHGASFPLIREKVVYNGAHSGDWIPHSQSAQLLEEAGKLGSATSDQRIIDFAGNLIQLAEASIATGNPVVF